MSKILFICEGRKTEKKFCNLIIEKYFLNRQKEKEYIAFGTNIYGLYDEMSRDDGLDIISLLMEKAKAKRDMYNYEMLKNGGFAEVYLIFDYDPHAPQYDFNKIKKMIEYFNDETGNGKIYINYPMFESLKHFRSIPDKDYNDYCIDITECVEYKEYINKISCVTHIGDIDEDKLKIIIEQNLNKYEYLSKKELKNYDDYANNFSQLKLLNIQKSLEDKKIIVFNSSVFWGIDYFGDKYYSIFERTS